MAIAGDRVVRAVGNCESKGLQPGGSTFGIGGKDDIVVAWMELVSQDHDALGDAGRETEAL